MYIEGRQTRMLGLGMRRIGRIVHHQKINEIEILGCISFMLVIMRDKLRKFDGLAPVNFRNKATQKDSNKQYDSNDASQLFIDVLHKYK